MHFLRASVERKGKLKRAGEKTIKSFSIYFKEICMLKQYPALSRAKNKNINDYSHESAMQQTRIYF